MCSCFFRFSSPLFRSLYIRLNIQRDFCLDHAVIKGRVMVTPLIVLSFRDLSCPELLSSYSCFAAFQFPHQRQLHHFLSLQARTPISSFSVSSFLSNTALSVTCFGSS